MLLAPEANFCTSLDVGVPFLSVGLVLLVLGTNLVDAALGSGSLALTLLWHCRKADHAGSPLHIFFCLLLPLLTLQLLDLGSVVFVPDTVCSFVILFGFSSLHHL